MTMNKLISSLVSNAKKEAEEVIKSAESEVDKLIAEEKAKRVLLLKNAEEECEQMLSDQHRERIAWARLEARRLIAESKEDAIHAVLEGMYESLPELKKGNDYAKFINNGVASAVAELGSEEGLTLHVAKGDKKFVTKFKGKVLEDLDAIGGLILERSDGKVCVNSTLESLVENRKDDLRKKIYERLFEDESPRHLPAGKHAEDRSPKQLPVGKKVEEERPKDKKAEA